MAASLAQIANGAKFQRGNGGTPEVYQDVAEVNDIGMGAPTAPDIDVSHLGSSAREKRAGLQDFGTATVKMNYVEGDAIQQAMEDEVGLNTPRNYRVVHSDGIHGYQYVLIIKSMGTTGYVVDGKLERTATFAVSGKPTRL